MIITCRKRIKSIMTFAKSFIMKQSKTAPDWKWPTDCWSNKVSSECSCSTLCEENHQDWPKKTRWRISCSSDAWKRDQHTISRTSVSTSQSWRRQKLGSSHFCWNGFKNSEEPSAPAVARGTVQTPPAVPQHWQSDHSIVFQCTSWKVCCWRVVLETKACASHGDEIPTIQVGHERVIAPDDGGRKHSSRIEGCPLPDFQKHHKKAGDQIDAHHMGRVVTTPKRI